MSPKDALHYGVKDGDIVKVLCESVGRRLIFDDVLVRVGGNYCLEFHVDTDEGNAALLKTGDTVWIVQE